MIAKTLKAAQTWFLYNSEGTLTCEKENGEQKVVECYAEAEEFFKLTPNSNG